MDQAISDGKAVTTLQQRFSGRERQLLAMLLFALAGGVLIAAEFGYQRTVPSLVWFALMIVTLLAWHASTKAAPSQGTVAAIEAEPLAVRVTSPPTGHAMVLSAVSHEIRTPISAIVGFAELLRDADNNANGKKQREEYASLVLDNARQLQGVVNDVLEANRLKAGGVVLNEQDCDFGEIVEVVTRQCTAEAEERGISIIAHIANGFSLHADTNRLKKAVHSIIQNAIKFSPADGMVNIKMLKGKNGELVLSVTDAGAGLQSKDIDRVFQPFIQLNEGTARPHGGLGLGLYISRQIARLHGGELHILSQVGVGTEARLVIPAARVKIASRTNPMRKTA